MKEKPRVAILFAAYNGVKYIEDQVNSILNQKNVSVTLFVSVDPSSDGTEAWFSDFRKREHRVELLPTGVKFGRAALNFFRLIKDVDFSNFDYICFSDQDDIWLDDKIDHAINCLHLKNASAYSSDVTAFWEDGRKMLVKKSQPQVKWDFLFEAAGPGCTYVFREGYASFLKKKLLEIGEDVKLIDQHDWFCYAMARGNGFTWIIDDYPGMLYRQHANNQVGVNSGVRAFFNRIRQIYNLSWIKQVYLIGRLIDLEDKKFLASVFNSGRIGMLYLSLQSTKCRRKLSEKFIFFFICLILFFRYGKLTKFD